MVLCGPGVVRSCVPAVLPENSNIGRKHPFEGEERLRERERE
jgi:hypothetical protein